MPKSVTSPQNLVVAGSGSSLPDLKVALNSDISDVNVKPTLETLSHKRSSSIPHY